jgi:fibronectin type 3 domain-containing protein
VNQGYSKLAYLLFLAAALAGQMQAATQSTLSSPAAGAVLPATAQFVFPCVTGENQIEFRLGTGAASSQPFNIARAVMNVNRSCLVTTVPAMTPSATRVAESGSTITVTAAIPQNGAALTATLFSVINGTYPNKQYAFTEGKGTGAAPKVSTLTCATATIPYEGTDSCTVTLSAAALPSTVVTLSSSSGNLVAPASVAVGTGAVSAAFSVTAAAVSVATAVTLTATLNGSVSTSLTLEPAVPAAAYQVNLSWQEPPGSDAAASYVIERALVTFGIVGAYAAIGTATAPSYSDLDVTNGDEYSYQIVAVDAAGNQSAPSAAAVAAIP